MSYQTKRVVICQDGTFGPEHYADFVETMKVHLERAMHPLEVGKPRVPVATVEVVATAAETAAKADRGQADVVIFMSKNMVPAAHHIRFRHTGISVIVLTGADVEGEPFIVPKGALKSGDALVSLVQAV